MQSPPSNYPAYSSSNSLIKFLMFQIPIRHHHVPEFYLTRWASEEDGRVFLIKNLSGKIIKDRHPPSETGYEPHLYSYSEDHDSPNRAQIETDFFSPLDREGAKIIRKFISGKDLNHSEVNIWPQFLCAMRIRTPENVIKMKGHAREYLTRQLELDQTKYALLRRAKDPDRFIDWVSLAKPNLLEDVGVSQLPKIASSKNVLNDILKMNWHAVHFQCAPLLLTSDRPCIFTTGLGNPDCVIALPLSPVCAFFAFYPESGACSALMSASPALLSSAINRSVVGQAKVRAYSQSEFDAPDSFYKDHLASSG